ncbi:hypothetical protein yrohd0001_23800 [Yersinia rohdei ATCC 43380]|nr:hypothetical protein yrohd0001_23800 [Yersinia rohdei ATCC 43380]
MLAAFTHPHHILEYAHRDSFTGCLPAIPSSLGIPLVLKLQGC